jgi:small subunit ribosomal protein S1
LNKGDVVEALVLSIEADRERISLGMKQLVSDSFGDYVEANKKGSRVTAKILGHTDDRVDLALSDEVRGYLPMKDYTNSMSDTPLEEGADLEVVIANVNMRDREIILSLRALEKQEEKSALKDNAIKNKEIEEATKSNIGDLIKAEMQDSDKGDE